MDGVLLNESLMGKFISQPYKLYKKRKQGHLTSPFGWKLNDGHNFR